MGRKEIDNDQESGSESNESTQKSAIIELEVIGLSQLPHAMQNSSVDELRLYRHQKINEYLRQIQDQLNTTYTSLVREVNVEDLNLQRTAIIKKIQSDQDKHDQTAQLNIMVRLDSIKSVDQQIMQEQKTLEGLKRKFEKFSDPSYMRQLERTKED